MSLSSWAVISSRTAAAAAVAAGFTAIVDATFLQAAQRAAFAALAVEAAVPFAIVDLDAPVDCLRARILHRAAARTDPSEANAVVLAADGRRVVLVGFDLLYVGPELTGRVSDHLRTHHGIAADDVLLAASHTHFAPATDPGKPIIGIADPGYIAVVGDRVIALLDRLLADPGAPVGAGMAERRADHSVNRRLPTPTPDGGTRIAFAPNPAGRRDERVTVVRLEREPGVPVALVWHYTCHPVGLPDRSLLSPDYPGIVRARLRTVFGRDLPVLFLQGFCGDVRPVARQGSWWWGRRRTPEAFIPFDDAGYAAWADGLAGCCLAAARAARSGRLEGPLASAARDIPAECLVADGAGRPPLRLQRLDLGRLSLCALSAEPTQDIAAVFPPAPAGIRRLAVGYAGDVFGYLPSDAQIAVGGYEVDGFLPLFGLGGPLNPDAGSVTGAALADLLT